MSIKEIELAIAQLSPNELHELRQWFDEFLESLWDQQIESDLQEGRLDGLIQEAEADYAAGRTKPLLIIEN